MKHKRVRWRGRRGLWRFIPRQPCEWMKGGRGHVWVERRDSPAAETDATLVRLHFPPPNTTEHANLERVSARACEHHNPSTSIRQDVLSHFPDESHPASSAALLSLTVLAFSETSAAGLTPHCSKKGKKKSCEKARERERERDVRDEERAA